MSGLTAEEREALAEAFGEWLFRMHGVTSSCDHGPEADGIAEVVAPMFAARVAEARADLAAVCDAYGLPHSAVALDRHLRNNAAATIENWRHVAEVAQARLANVEALRVKAEEAARFCRSSDNAMSGRLVAAACHEGYARDLAAALAPTPTEQTDD